MELDQFVEKNDKFEARSYRQYLSLESITYKRELLSRLNGSPVHDELLFIVLHQNIELWFLQALEESREARRLISQGEIRLAIDELNRITRIFGVLTTTWDVLATLRPREFWRFREFFGGASGFQSAQFRELEFSFGLRGDAERDLRIHGEEIKDEAACARLREELARPSLWDEVNRALSRQRFELPDEVLGREPSRPYPWPRAGSAVTGSDSEAGLERGCRAVEDAWLDIYSRRSEFPDLYDLGEELVDLSAAFSGWRFKHIMTVERFIGRLPGSAKDSDGVPYLLTTLDKRPFPELWSVRNRFNFWSDERYREDRPSA
jgi:tryptophan 2,3-dioxygenase